MRCVSVIESDHKYNFTKNIIALYTRGVYRTYPANASKRRAGKASLNLYV